MAFEVVDSGEDDDYYNVTMSFRPEGTFSGQPGQEQFFIDKEGAIAHRQVILAPSTRIRWRVPLTIFGFVVVIGAVAIGGVVLTGGTGEGDPDVSPFAANGRLPNPADVQAVVPFPDVTLTPPPVAPAPDTLFSTPTDTQIPIESLPPTYTPPPKFVPPPKPTATQAQTTTPQVLSVNPGLRRRPTDTPMIPPSATHTPVPPTRTPTLTPTLLHVLSHRHRHRHRPMRPLPNLHLDVKSVLMCRQPEPPEKALGTISSL